jgi:hypothetical protein
MDAVANNPDDTKRQGRYLAGNKVNDSNVSPLKVLVSCFGRPEAPFEAESSESKAALN